ncbi:MAG TPA: hypothetical protein VF389_03470, partial [Woeseiaceae bacterium]
MKINVTATTAISKIRKYVKALRIGTVTRVPVRARFAREYGDDKPLPLRRIRKTANASQVMIPFIGNDREFSLRIDVQSGNLGDG